MIPENYTIDPRTKVIIGTTIIENEHCKLDRDKVWRQCYNTLRPLGTSAPSWHVVEREFGGQIGQYVLGQAIQTWEKDSGKTRKEIFLAQGDSELVSYLDCKWGVQFSLCTGVAKRVLLRQLVAELIPTFAERYIAIGQLDQQLWNTIQATGLIDKLNNQHHSRWYAAQIPDHRSVATQLISSVIRRLEHTGLNKARDLVIAWPRVNDVDQSFEIPCKAESAWARILEDSQDSVTFAYASFKCLVSSSVKCEGREANWKHSTALFRTAMLPPMSITAPSSWEMRHGELYFIRTKESLIHLHVHQHQGNTTQSAHTYLFTRSVNLKEQMRNRILNHRKKEERRLREGHQDIQPSVDVLVTHMLENL